MKVEIPRIIHNVKGILFLGYSYFHIWQFLKIILISTFMNFLILIFIVTSHFTQQILYFVKILFCSYTIFVVFCKLRFYAVSAFS